MLHIMVQTAVSSLFFCHCPSSSSTMALSKNFRGVIQTWQAMYSGFPSDMDPNVAWAHLPDFYHTQTPTDAIPPVTDQDFMNLDLFGVLDTEPLPNFSVPITDVKQACPDEPYFVKREAVGVVRLSHSIPATKWTVDMVSFENEQRASLDVQCGQRQLCAVMYKKNRGGPWIRDHASVSPCPYAERSIKDQSIEEFVNQALSVFPVVMYF